MLEWVRARKQGLFRYRNYWRYWPEILFGMISIGLVIRLFRLCVPECSDFEVYWYAIQAWTQGKSPYSLYSTGHGLVFKYPPWVLILFFPFAFLSLPTSKVIWIASQVVGMGLVMRWLVSKGVALRLTLFVSLLFWWMFLAHAYFGQIVIWMMVFALWGCERAQNGKAQYEKAQYGETPYLKAQNAKLPDEKSPNDAKSKPQPGAPSPDEISPWAVAGLLFILSAKVFSLVSIGGIRQGLFRKRVLLSGMGVLLGSHLILLLLYPSALSSGIVPLFESLYRDWVKAATSGGVELGANIVRGQQNHGFVAVILRVFGIQANEVHYDLGVAVVLAAGLSALWAWSCKNLKFEEKWAGWLSVGVICHPLAWHHSFMMAFPLCCFSLQKSVNTKDFRLIGLSLLGICCIGVFIPQLIGVQTVVPLEYVGSKSWGVVFSAIALVLSDRKLRGENTISFSSQSDLISINSNH